MEQEPRCPDCGAVGMSMKIAHADTCPIGVGIDEICADDREWFASHLGESERRRPVSWAEGADLKVMGYMPDVPGEWAGEVVVRQLEPGVRSRRFDEVYFIPEVGDSVQGPRPKFGNEVLYREGLERWEPSSRAMGREIEAAADRAIAAKAWMEVVWEGTRIIVVSEAYLAAAAEIEGKSWEEATKAGYRLERDDGHRAYVWRVPKAGKGYGIGKPRL